MVITNKTILAALKEPKNKNTLAMVFGKDLEPRHKNRINMLVTRLKNKGLVKDHDFTLTELVEEGSKIVIKESTTKGLVAV